MFNILRSIILASVLLGITNPLMGKDALRILSLSGDGSSTILLNGTTAFIHDGGREGPRGIQGALVDGMPVLNFLVEKDVKRLVVSCSHPHKDHMGGLESLVQDLKPKQFESINFVDGFAKSRAQEKVPTKSLYNLYAKTHGTSPPPEVTYNRAWNADGFSSLRPTSSNVKVENYIYDPGQFRAKDGTLDTHDASLIISYEIKDVDGVRAVVDFDDASSEVILKWASEVPPKKASVVVMSHHGSRHNDMSPVLARNRTAGGSGVAHGVQEIVFTVNTRNQYLHPDPSVLRMAIDAVGVDHVHITGSVIGDSIAIDTSGNVSRGMPGSPVARLIAHLDGRIANAEREVTSNTSARQRLRFSKQIDELSSIRETVKAELPSNRLANSGVAAFQSAMARTRADEAAKYGAEAPHQGGAKNLGRYRTFNRIIESEGRVRFGGVLIGSEPTGISIQSVSFESADNDPESALINIGLVDGNTATYGPVSMYVLWAAYNYVFPTRELRDYFSGIPIEPSTGGLVGGVPALDGSTFALHPAIADTPIATDGMKLDLAPRASEYELFNASTPERIRELKWPAVSGAAYQWFDSPALITESSGTVAVSRKSDKSSCLLRFRTIEAVDSAFPIRVDDTDPEAIKKFADADSALGREVPDPAHVKEVLATILNSEIEGDLDEDVASENPEMVRATDIRDDDSRFVELMTMQQEYLDFWRGIELEWEKEAIRTKLASERWRATFVDASTLSSDEQSQFDESVPRMLASNVHSVSEVDAEETDFVCTELTFGRTMNQFAQLVAILHRYLDLGGVLPPLQPSLVPQHVSVRAEMLFQDVWADEAE